MATKIADRKSVYKIDHYAGQWVAFLNESAAAHHLTLKGLMKELDARGLEKNIGIPRTAKR